MLFDCSEFYFARARSLFLSSLMITAKARCFRYVATVLKDMREAGVAISDEVIDILKRNTRGYGDVMRIMYAAQLYDIVGRVAEIQLQSGEIQEGNGEHCRFLFFFLFR